MSLGVPRRFRYDCCDFITPSSPVKALVDFFPVLAFFVAYMVFGQDIYLATKVFMAATLLQIVYLLIRRQPITLMHKAVAVIAFGLGGLALFLHNPIFIKWKPTVANWLIAAVFLGSQYYGEKPMVQRVFEQVAQMDARSWRQLNWAWVIFSVFLGALNLYVVYNFSELFWVKFKLFGLIGLSFAFGIAQVFWIMSRSSSAEANSADSTGVK
jgi:intracellular septation protein